MKEEKVKRRSLQSSCSTATGFPPSSRRSWEAQMQSEPISFFVTCIYVLNKYMPYTFDTVTCPDPALYIMRIL